MAEDIGLEQRLDFTSRSIGDITPPSAVPYTGNLLYCPWTVERSFVPYVTGGGGFSLLERGGFTNDNHTFFTANTGGGVKWLWTDRWGIRTDYRFLWVASDSDAPTFFGRLDQNERNISWPPRSMWSTTASPGPIASSAPRRSPRLCTGCRLTA